MLKLARTVWKTLTDRERLTIIVLSVAVVVMAGLEVVNVSAITPFLSVAGNPGWR